MMRTIVVAPKVETVAYVRDRVERYGVRPTGVLRRFSDSTIAKLAAGLPVSRSVAKLSQIRVDRLVNPAGNTGQ